MLTCPHCLGYWDTPTIREILDSTKFTRACSGVVPAAAIDFLYGEALVSRA
jgi:hypothetical protein